MLQFTLYSTSLEISVIPRKIFHKNSFRGVFRALDRVFWELENNFQPLFSQKQLSERVLNTPLTPLIKRLKAQTLIWHLAGTQEFHNFIVNIPLWPNHVKKIYEKLVWSPGYHLNLLGTFNVYCESSSSYYQKKNSYDTLLLTRQGDLDSGKTHTEKLSNTEAGLKIYTAFKKTFCWLSKIWCWNIAYLRTIRHTFHSTVFDH